MEAEKYILRKADLKKIQKIPFEYLNPKSKVVQLIDPGHGGIIDDVYVTAPEKMYEHPNVLFLEGVVNRQIAYYIMYHCYKEKMSYKLITDTDEDVYLTERAEIANLYAEEVGKKKYSTYFHSIHCNAYEDDLSINRYQVHIYRNIPEIAAKIAKYMVENQEDTIGINNGWVRTSNYTVLQKTLMPSVLSENGFFTNEAQAKKLINPIYQNELGKFYCNIQKQIVKDKVL